MTTPISPDFSHPLRVAQAIALNARPQRLTTVGGPVTRPELDVPYSSSTTLTDTGLFIHPTDQSRRFWLPRYHLALERVSGEERYRMAFAEHDGRWQLSLWLEMRPAPGLENVANRFEVLDHELELQLGYVVQSAGSLNRLLVFQEIQRQDTRTEATLFFNGLAQRDEVYAALADAAVSPSLVARRRIRVAVPEHEEVRQPIRLPIHNRPPRLLLPDPRLGRPIQLRRADRELPHPPMQQRLAFPNPVIKFIKSVRETIRGREILRHYLAVTNWQQYHKSLFAKAPDLPPCGANTNASRTWVDILDGQTSKRIYGYCALGSNENLQKLWVATQVNDPNPPRSVRVRLDDRKTNRKVTSNAVALRRTSPEPPPEPTYLIVEADMEQAVAPNPFAFSRDLHGYIFDALDGNGGSNGAGGLARFRESFDGIVHTYFQDVNQRTVFYYFADEFRIARHGGDFRPAFMTLRVRSNGGSTQNTSVTLDYAISPYTNPARLQTARSQLAAETGEDEDAIEFQPFITSEVSFTIQRPTETGRLSEQRPSSALMLQGPIIDTLAIPVTDFQLAFHAMLGRTASLLAGTIEIKITDWPSEVRQFVADFARLAGSPVDVQSDNDHGAVTLSMTNVTESPLALSDLRFRVQRRDAGEEFAPGTAVPEGTQLAPAETVTVAATLPDIPGTDPMTLSLASGAQVLPDESAILDAILDRSTLEYFRDIEINALAGMFVAPAGRPQDQINNILVEFEGGATVELNAGKLKVTARIDYPFDDVILGQISHDGTYRYWLTIIRIDGRQERDTEPRTNQSSILFLAVSA